MTDHDAMGSRPPTVIVSGHAVRQAQMRYRRPGWGWPEVKHDVVAAVAAGRVGKHARGIHAGLRHGARLCWTEDGRRVYVIKRERGRLPSDGLVWVVLTSLIPDYVKEAA